MIDGAGLKKFFCFWLLLFACFEPEVVALRPIRSERRLSKLKNYFTLLQGSDRTFAVNHGISNSFFCSHQLFYLGTKQSSMVPRKKFNGKTNRRPKKIYRRSQNTYNLFSHNLFW